MTRPLRMILLEGPGDAIGSYQHWKAGRDNPDVTHVPFSSQFYDVAAQFETQLWLIGENPRRGHVVDKQFHIEHRGNASIHFRGLAYHLVELLHGLRILFDIIRFRADIVFMSTRPYPFLMSVLRPLGVRCVVTLHCVLWPKYSEPNRWQRLLHRLNSGFFQRGCAAILCVSADIKNQVRSLTGGVTAPFVDFFPLFRHITFDGISPPDIKGRPFRVMFAGRIERVKGVFDLLEIARRFRERGRRDIIFELCGDGSDLQRLKAMANEAQLSEFFVLLGWCDQAAMRAAFSRSHVVVVPTTTAFIEGFNMVVVEALLAQRPVVTSSVCPAINYVRPAVAEVPPNDVDAYEAAILRLADDPSYYTSLLQHCQSVSARFFDPNMSYRSALEHCMKAITDHRTIQSREF